ncbi:ecto-NOX disulfide-thiol exchanger 1-like [Scleropages formosus]|uniref:Ecto-NOX disulfide-thiol exchanger 1-like n=1 Tax=Scleropages formosus TaxID=113540 RepID=A0A0P7V690_SCLFO|nr:ecto-NOX disulfide-thiol exchanger 1-like [Scleropages formosus]
MGLGAQRWNLTSEGQLSSPPRPVTGTPWELGQEERTRPSMASAADEMGTLGPEQTHAGVPVADPTAWTTAMNNLGIVPMGVAGQPLVSDSICIQGFDPSLGIIGPINPLMPGISLVPRPPVPAEIPVVKEIIHCKSCTLFPQNPNLPPPSTRERPPGCKTVFVGGLPENASEDIIREVFDQCGEIVAVRKSKKNFCHIRFAEEYMVDKALYLSGYRMRIGSSTDKKDSGRIHVDFAQARDDLYEWECRQRLLAREERHRRRVQEDLLRPPSPPPIMHYSEHEAALLAERLKDDGKFSEATAVLVTWIERGEVSRRSANHFYSMIQSANGHVRRLMSEKAQREEEMEQARERFRNALLAILAQFEQITAVFTAATRQRAWDHFSKAQRKNIDMWRKQCEELRNAHSEEIMGIRREEEMEMSEDDSDENPSKKMRPDDSALAAQACALREENDSLRWQLDAYRNEVELLKQEQSLAPRPGDSSPRGEQRLPFLQQSILGMQQVPTASGASSPSVDVCSLAFPADGSPTLPQQLRGLQEELKSKEQEMERAKEEQRRLEGELRALREKVSQVQFTRGLPLGCKELWEAAGGINAHAPRSLCPQRMNGCTLTLPPTADRSVQLAVRGPSISEREALLLVVPSSACGLNRGRVSSRCRVFLHAFSLSFSGIVSTFLHVHPFGANIEYLWSYIQRLDSKISAGELEGLMVRLPHMFKQEFSGVGATLEKRWKFCGFEGIQSM